MTCALQGARDCYSGRHGFKGHVARFSFSGGVEDVSGATVIYRENPYQAFVFSFRVVVPSMKRIAAFCLTTWSAAALLYFGQHSVALIALSGVVVFGGYDLLRP